MYVPGVVLLWASFVLVVLSTAAYAQVARGRERWLQPARQAFVLATVAVVIAAAVLTYLLVTHDFRLHYVWSYSDMELPLSYLLSTLWAGQEGSFLLWVVFGCLIGLPLIRYAGAYESRVMIFYNLTVAWLLLLLVKQTPFRFLEGVQQAMIPADGQGLNPLLQNPWMVIHPPVMFLGYASLGVPFAFALAAVWMRRYEEWVRVSLPWVLVSLVTLGAAIMLGGYWAYETLGWGGYWGWDPVENASLVPWLATVALVHGLLLQRGRDRFRRMNLSLAVAAYLLVLYATFLTRSGVLSNFSVHSFVDLGISGWLIFGMLFFLLLSAGMLVWRWREIPTQVGSEPFVSRTVFLVLGIVLVLLIGAVVLLGTSAPIISRLWGEPSQVGPDFYNRTGFWLAVMFAVLLGVTPFLGWRKMQQDAGRKLVVSLAITVVLVGLGAFAGLNGTAALAYAAAAVFAVVANSWTIAQAVRQGRLRSTGGPLAHVGMGLMLLAFLTTGWFDREQKVELKVNQPTEVLGFTLTFQGVQKPTPTAREQMVVKVDSRDGRSFELRPLMWVNRKTDQLVANPDIKSFMTSDLYLAPSSFSPGEAEPPSAKLSLKKGEPVPFRDWTFTFKRFDMSRQGETPGTMTVGVVIEARRAGGEPAEVWSRFSFSDRSGGTGDLVAIPGGGELKLRTAGLNVDAGEARVELFGGGGGVGRTAVLHKGETLTYKTLKVTFADFDLAQFNPDAGKIDFGVVFRVERGGQSVNVVPQFRGSADGASVTPAEIPSSGGMALSVGRVDAENKAVELVVLDPDAQVEKAVPASLVLDVSTKPLIALVWLGTLLVIGGTVLAIVDRRRNGAAEPVVDKEE